jgi:hypothetical protein
MTRLLRSVFIVGLTTLSLITGCGREDRSNGTHAWQFTEPAPIFDITVDGGEVVILTEKDNGLEAGGACWEYSVEFGEPAQQGSAMAVPVSLYRSRVREICPSPCDLTGQGTEVREVIPSNLIDYQLVPDPEGPSPDDSVCPPTIAAALGPKTIW